MITQLNKEILRSVLKEYEYEPDYINDDISKIILHKAVDNLPEADKIIFLLYSEIQSLRKLGELLGVSYATARKQINKIKKQIKYDMDKLNNNSPDSMLYS